MSPSLSNVHVHPAVDSNAKLQALIRATGMVAFQSNRGRGIILVSREAAMIRRAARDLHIGAPCR